MTASTHLPPIFLAGTALALACVSLAAALYRWAPGFLLDAMTALGRRHAGLRRATLQVGPDRWHYLDNGKPGPMLLLVHGFAADKESWLKVAAALKRSRLRIVVPDLPGFGASPPPRDAGYGIDAQAGRLHHFVAALGGGRIHLAGHSMGGYVAGAYAARQPEEVIDAYLVAPAGIGGGVPAWLRDRMRSEGRNPLIVETVEQLMQTLALAMHRPPRIPARLARVLVAREAPNHALRVAQSGFWESPALEAMLADSPVRLRVAWGMLDRVVPASGAATLVCAVPNASLWEIPETGHMPPQECAPALAADLLRFIASSDAPAS